MRVSRLVLLTILFGLLLTTMVSATSVHVQPTNQSSNYIFFDETASYQLTITNDAEEDKVYSWSINPVEWIIDGKNSMKVDAGSSRTIELLVTPRPSNFRGPGLYVVPITVQDAFGGSTQSQINIYIKSINEKVYSYLASVALGASINDPLDPRDDANIQIQIRNRNILEIESLHLIIDGETFYKEELLSLAALEEKTLRYKIPLDLQVKPGTYNLNVRLVYENKTISEVKELYDVDPYATIDRDVTSSKKFFKLIKISSLTNNGNVLKEVNTDIDSNIFKRLFTRIDIEANTVEKNPDRSWTLILAPNETAVVTVIENYRSLFYLFVLAIIVLGSYFTMRSPITMKKQIIVTGKDEEGISEMKVRIYLKNRTDKAYYNLRLLDKAPAIADVHAPHGLGVMAPSKIVKTEKKGTIIKWDFDTLDAYEERIVSYTLKAKLKIIGNLTLPAVKVKFENVKGISRTTQSGKAVIGTTQ